MRFFECCLCDARIRLTKRELEILHWGAQGKTSWEISKILGCSEANVNFHFSRIRRKLNVSSRAEAIYCAMKTGLLKS
ncbi:response regulator transcription factor [Metapseudomonas resinovorans]|uniref:response regulator transcription factor n=1 Tax=Metapseudomonas resinovorans TaxID=53412 RepID=UPI0009DC3EBA|nr:helix-turn-helix transcriptional regulator [Pseudomonas resinovorans]